MHSDDEQYLGQQSEPQLIADPWLVDSQAKQVYSRFVDRVNEAQDKLVRSNNEAEKKGSLPYFYLLPRKDKADWKRNIPAQGVPNSVTI